MDRMAQGSLFYEDIYDATEKAIASSGKPKKELACIIYPGRSIDTAKSLFTRQLSPENIDTHYTVETMEKLMQETDPRHVLYYLCDKYGFERPPKKTRTTFERDIRGALHEIQDKVSALGRELKVFEVQRKAESGEED